MKQKPLTRRDFLLGSATAGASALLAACTPPTPKVIYEIVKETVLVEQVVKETVVVEQVVEKTVEVDRQRAEMTLAYTPLDQEGTFHRMGWSDDAAPTVIAEFEEWFAEWYPNMKYEVSGLPWMFPYWETLPAMMAAGDHPDVAVMHFTRTATFACQGWMRPIDDYIDALPPPDWPDDYHKAAEDNMAYQGVQYGLAVDWAPKAVLINLDIMEEAGMPYPVPDNWTWDDVLEYAMAATRETPQGKQFGLTKYVGPWAQWNMVRAWGGRFFNEDVTESRFDDPKTIDCFQWVWDAIHKHHVIPSQAELTEYDDEFWPLFEEEYRVGMVSTLSDEARLVLNNVGDGFRLGIGPYPLGPSGQRFGYEGNTGWFIPSRSAWPDIAYELMRWRLTDDDQILRFAVSGFGGFSARKSAGRWNIVTIEEELPEYGHVAWELGAENQEHFPLFPEYGAWTQLYWPSIGGPVMQRGGPDVEGALLRLHEETNELFAQREPCVEPGTG